MSEKLNEVAAKIAPGPTIVNCAVQLRADREPGEGPEEMRQFTAISVAEQTAQLNRSWSTVVN